jgi:electron transfer flavoprotein alpha subunit
MPSVLVVGEVAAGSLSGATAELLTAAGKLAGDPVSVVLLSSGDAADGAQAAATTALGHGVGRVFVLQNPALQGGGTGGFDAPVAALKHLIESKHPDVVLFARTDFGYNVGPRVAFRLGVPVAQDCIDLAYDAGAGSVIATRPVYGGNALAVVRFKAGRPQIAIVRPAAFEPHVPPASPPRGEIETIGIDIPPHAIRSRLVDTVREARQGVRLEQAEIVVAGGRGLGGPEPFKRLHELARVLGGAVGASRAACDAGWIDHAHQIGLTGKSIAPKLYITVGISGASQHMAGCSGARSIVAINKDPDANIFREASFGVVGEWQKVLPAFIEAVRELGRA